MLTADLVLSAYPEPARRNRRVRELAALLLAFTEAKEAAPAVDALAVLARWLRIPDRRLPLPAGVTGDPPPPRRRLVAFVAVAKHGAVAGPLRARLSEFFAGTGGLKLFAEAGLPTDRGLLRETMDRLWRRLLPSPRDDDDLAAVLPRLFPGAAELAWLENLEPDHFSALAEALGAGEPGAQVFDRVFTALTEAVVLIGARVQGLGLAEGIRDRGRSGPIAESPFFILPRAADRFMSHLGDPGPRLEAEREFRAALQGARQDLALVEGRLENQGVSLDVVYVLEVIEEALARAEQLITVLSAAPGPERITAAQRLVVMLVRARHADRSLRALAYSNLHLLARKLVERAGETGEHYITSTRREYLAMIGRAAGGGVITAFTAAVKLAINRFGWSPFVLGLASSGNYALSFVLIQLCGFTLATKQPSMTAAALAGAIKSGGRGEAELVTQTARIVRSQLAAAIGNVLTVTTTAVAINHFVRLRTGAAFLAADEAAAVLASFHPTKSGTAWYAIVTGVILWAASLVGGWAENFAVCHRLPQAIAEHPLGRFFGRRTLRFAGNFFARHISGIGVSLALAALLGMAPPIGQFLGVPLDVRHVTLSTGQLAFALAEAGWAGLQRPAAAWAVAGIAVIFVLNLGTSFFLALAVALRARDVPRRNRLRLFSAIARRLVSHPREFLWPT